MKGFKLFSLIHMVMANVLLMPTYSPKWVALLTSSHPWLISSFFYHSCSSGAASSSAPAASISPLSSHEMSVWVPDYPRCLGTFSSGIIVPFLYCWWRAPYFQAQINPFFLGKLHLTTDPKVFSSVMAVNPLPGTVITPEDWNQWGFRFTVLVTAQTYLSYLLTTFDKPEQKTSVIMVISTKSFCILQSL